MTEKGTECTCSRIHWESTCNFCRKVTSETDLGMYVPGGN